jgi:hypothetical protein
MDTDKNHFRTYKCSPHPEWRLFLPAVIAIAAVIGISLRFGVSWYWPVATCPPFLLTGFAIVWWPVIEPASGILRERALLFSRRVLAERTVPLTDFTEIFYEAVYGDVGDSDFRLGLRHKTGRKFWVEGRWAIRRSVEEKAWEISCKTGIKLTEWPF